MPASAPRATPPRPADAPDGATPSATTPPRRQNPAATVGGVSPDSRFVAALALPDAALTFGLDTPAAVGRRAAEGMLAAHAASNGGGGGGGGPAPRLSGHLIATGPPSPTLASPDDSPQRVGPRRVPPLLGDEAEEEDAGGGLSRGLSESADAAAAAAAVRSASPSPDGDRDSVAGTSPPDGRPAGAGAAGTTTTTTTTARPWPLAAPKGTWLYDVTLGAPPAAVRAAVTDPAFAARVLAARKCADVRVGPWSPPSTSASSTAPSQRRTLHYTAPVAAGGVLGAQRVACVEAHVATPLGGAAPSAPGAPAAPHRFTLTVTATTPDLPLYGGAFECEIVITGDAAPGESREAPAATRVTAFGRVIFKRKLAMVRRMLEANAVAGLKTAYAVHARELAAFLEAPATAAAGPAGSGWGDAAGALAARLAAGDPATLVAAAAALLVLALAVALASVAAAVRGVQGELAAARRDLAAIAAAAARAAANKQCG